MMRCALRLCIAISALWIASCVSKDEKPKDTAPKVVAPVVTDARTDLLLSWFEDGEPKVGAQVKDVPEEARKEIRVQDPTLPPENRDPSVIFLADLTKPQKNGHYPVRTVKRDEYEAKRRAAAEAASEAATPPQPTQPSAVPNAMPPAQAPAGASSVVMYATRHCPVCVKARRWLLDQKIPYVERDVERDPQAAQDLQKKGAAQGVPTNGVPIFEVRGRLLPGFDPAKIIQLLGGAIKTQGTV